MLSGKSKKNELIEALKKRRDIEFNLIFKTLLANFDEVKPSTRVSKQRELEVRKLQAQASLLLNIYNLYINAIKKYQKNEEEPIAKIEQAAIDKAKEERKVAMEKGLEKEELTLIELSLIAQKAVGSVEWESKKLQDKLNKDLAAKLLDPTESFISSTLQKLLLVYLDFEKSKPVLSRLKQAFTTTLKSKKELKAEYLSLVAKLNAEIAEAAPLLLKLVSSDLFLAAEPSDVKSEDEKSFIREQKTTLEKLEYASTFYLKDLSNTYLEVEKKYFNPSEANLLKKYLIEDLFKIKQEYDQEIQLLTELILHEKKELDSKKRDPKMKMSQGNIISSIQKHEKRVREYTANSKKIDLIVLKLEKSSKSALANEILAAQRIIYSHGVTKCLVPGRKNDEDYTFMREKIKSYMAALAKMSLSPVIKKELTAKMDQLTQQLFKYQLDLVKNYSETPEAKKFIALLKEVNLILRVDKPEDIAFPGQVKPHLHSSSAHIFSNLHLDPEMKSRSLSLIILPESHSGTLPIDPPRKTTFSLSIAESQREEKPVSAGSKSESELEYDSEPEDNHDTPHRGIK